MVTWAILGSVISYKLNYCSWVSISAELQGEEIVIVNGREVSSMTSHWTLTDLRQSGESEFIGVICLQLHSPNMSHTLFFCQMIMLARFLKSVGYPQIIQVMDDHLKY